MSSKKYRFSSLDRYYMEIAINLAKSQKGLTGTNPSVGCVIVKNNEIVSFSTTEINGRPHAETIALNKNIKKNQGSTVYLTLEPCSHYGKTPPCTNALIKSKVKKVIYSIEDQDSRSFNMSYKILNSNKIKTKSGLLKKETKDLYKNYIYTKKKKLPYVIGKLACSADFYIYKKKKFITNEHSRNVSHLFRYENQAILTSYKTINNDNPKLNCRINGLTKFSPSKIILDKDLKINLNSHILKNKTSSKNIIFHNSKNLKKISKLKKKGAKLIFFKIEKDQYFNLQKILKKIYNIGIHNLLIECGKSLTYKFISKKLINEFYLFKSDKNIKNKLNMNVSNIKRSLNTTYGHKSYINTYLDNDKLIHYY